MGEENKCLLLLLFFKLNKSDIQEEEHALILDKRSLNMNSEPVDSDGIS